MSGLSLYVTITETLQELIAKEGTTKFKSQKMQKDVVVFHFIPTSHIKQQDAHTGVISRHRVLLLIPLVHSIIPREAVARIGDERLCVHGVSPVLGA